MEPKPPADGDPGTPSSGQSPSGGAPEQSYPGQPPYAGQQYPGQPPYPSGQQPYPGQRPYPGQQYPGQPAYQEPRNTSVPAILSLVFGLIGGVLVSVILGIVALTQIPKKNQKGKGLAIAGLAISGLWLVGLVVGIAVFGDGEPDRDASGQVTTTQGTRADKLRVGDCVKEIKEAAEVRNLELVPCDQPNGGKVFAVFDLPAGKWPGLAAVQKAAEKGCVDRWAATGKPLDEGSDIIYLHPIENGWSLGDRGTTCLVTPK
ncbi:DUF4190 domain-containing protein [Kribbella swartbergensis]